MAPKRKAKEDPKTRKSKGKKRSKASNLTSEDKQPLVIKCKTIFKKRIVERALQKEDERTSEDERSERPTVKYWVKYSIEKDLLSVGDIEVIIDETEKTLNCSQCPFVTKNKWENDKRTTATLQTMEFGMRNHIVGQHLGGFPCHDCKPVATVHRSFSSHQKHQFEVHNERYKKAEAKVKACGKGKSGKDEDEGEGESDSSSSSSGKEGVWLNGEKRLKRLHKCRYPNCGQRFHKRVRWLRHENLVHGGLMKEEEQETSS